MKFTYSKRKGLSLDKSLSLEWLETNGLGGYSSSTIINCHTRKYHGLLVSNLDKLVDKYVLLSKVEDILQQENQEFLLSASQYPNFFQEGCFANYHEFALDIHPIFVFKFGKSIVTKEILLIYGEDTVLIKYTIQHGKNYLIKLRPLVAARNFHSLARKNFHIQQQTTNCKNGRKFKPYDELPDLYFQTNVDFDFKSDPLWYENFEYIQEKQRGFDYCEDLFTPGMFVLNFVEDNEIIFSCSTKPIKEDLAIKWQNEIQRRKNFAKNINGTALQKQLKKVGYSFIQKNVDEHLCSIVAGYHWFAEWGRDAMIALPGLTLYSGLEKECLAVLKTFAAHDYKGLIPNFLGKTSQDNAYNSVDASLWFAWAVQQYYLKTNDLKSIKQYLWPTLRNIFINYQQGTLQDIKMHENGLLYAGNKNTNLTWMDAMVDDKPVIARYGAIVEVNALWYNMLCFLHELAKQIDGKIKNNLNTLIKKAKMAFREMFWDEQLGYLRDYVNDQQQNCSIRPNQIFAISMPYSPLTKQMSTKIIKAVKQHLLTPYGLRTLSPEDVDYIGFYGGSTRQRDAAYHQGTVWPWLLGHFGEALIKVAGRQKASKVIQINNLEEHLFKAGIGSIAEIFSGDAPHQPNGCISQAWSVAEILRLTYLLKEI